MTTATKPQQEALQAPHGARVLPERVRIGDVELSTYECSCEVCRGMCHRRPCLGTPDDIEKIIDAGHAEKLMAEYAPTADGKTVWMVQPANVGYEGLVAPLIPGGTCSFLTRDGKCSLHDAGLKPAEGKLALCSEGRRKFDTMGEYNVDISLQFSKEWHTERGLEVGRKWRAALDEGKKDTPA